MTRMPSLFVSHGAPTFALEPGVAGPALAALGRELPRPEETRRKNTTAAPARGRTRSRRRRGHP